MRADAVTVEWRGVGPELLLHLDRNGDAPLSRQLQAALREAIRSGRLAHGARVPSSRSLASHLQVSRGLVVECYEQLVAEGYLASEIGRGTTVAYRPPLAPRRQRPAWPTADPDPVDVDFEYGVPDMTSFPMRDWIWALTTAGRTATAAERDDGDGGGAGSARLRQVVAEYQRRVRASDTTGQDVVVVPGFRHGLNVVLRTLASRGVTHVGLEDPGPIDHDTLVRRAGLVPVPVPVDDEGLDVEALAASPARAVVVTPAHQCPGGAVMSARRRHELVAWSGDRDGWIVEDDYDAEFRYDRQAVGSLQGLAPDRVIGMGSVSKTLAPTLRLGWIVSPPDLLDATVHEKRLLSRGAPGLDQVALAHLIASGRYDRHIRQMRAVYAARRASLVEAIAELAPSVEVGGLAAGCHATLRLPEGTTEEEVVRRCAARSVRFYAMTDYRLARTPHPPVLVAGFGNITERAIRTGVAALAESLDDIRRHG